MSDATIQAHSPSDPAPAAEGAAEVRDAAETDQATGAASRPSAAGSVNLSTRFARSLVVVVGTLLALFAVVAMYFTSDRAEAALEERLRGYLTIYETALGVPIIRGDSRAIEDYVASIMKDDDVVYVQISTDDSVLAKSERDTFDIAQLETYLAEGTYALGRVNVQHRGVDVGAFELGLSKSTVNNVLLDNAFLITGFTIAILVSILITTYLVFRRLVTLPIAALRASAGAIAGGDLNAEISVGGRDEVGELSRGFDHMRQSVLGLIADLSQANATLEDRVAERTAALGKANQLIVDSIQYASRIQSAVMPSKAQFQEAVSDHFLIWEPRDVVGGDFAWVQPVPGGHILIVGDCTGHGVPGAFMTLIACSMIENIVAEDRGRSPARMLAQIDKRLKHTLGQDERTTAGTDDGLEAGVCFVPSGEGPIIYAGARFSLWIAEPGHDPALPLREVKGDKVGVGHRDRGKSPALYTDQEISAPPGSAFYMATDGIIDQIGGAKKRSFGKRRLVTELAARSDAPMSEQSQGLTAALSAYQGEEGRRDDVTVLGFRPEIAPEEASGKG